MESSITSCVVHPFSALNINDNVRHLKHLKPCRLILLTQLTEDGNLSRFATSFSVKKLSSLKLNQVIVGVHAPANWSSMFPNQYLFDYY